MEDPTAGIIETIAGNGVQSHRGHDGPATETSLGSPQGVWVSADGSTYIADFDTCRIRRVGPDGMMATVAGTVGAGYSGDGGPATQAMLQYPRDVCVGTDGSIYIVDPGTNRIRKVDPAGVIATIAGNGEREYSGDGGPGTEAGLNVPSAIAIGPGDGALYIADRQSHRIRKLDRAGVITTAAGNGSAGYSGDGGRATEASLGEPVDVAVGGDGSIYIADCRNDVVRKVDPRGVISTVAGNGSEGYSGDGGPATQAQLNAPGGLALGDDGSIYIAVSRDCVVRRVSAAGIIATVAGTGARGYSGDGRRATEAALNRPRGLAIGPNGDLYVADTDNHRIRRVRLRPADPIAAKEKADALRAEAADSVHIWREAAELYLMAAAWDDALATAAGLLAAAPETDELERMRGEVLIARTHSAKGDDHEARRRLMRVLARTRHPEALREAADLLVGIYLRRGERRQAMATLDDLRVRTKDRGLVDWIGRRLKEIAGE